MFRSYRAVYFALCRQLTAELPDGFGIRKIGSLPLHLFLNDLSHGGKHRYIDAAHLIIAPQIKSDIFDSERFGLKSFYGCRACDKAGLGCNYGSNFTNCYVKGISTVIIGNAGVGRISTVRVYGCGNGYASYCKSSVVYNFTRDGYGLVGCGVFCFNCNVCGCNCAFFDYPSLECVGSVVGCFLGGNGKSFGKRCKFGSVKNFFCFVAFKRYGNRSGYLCFAITYSLNDCCDNCVNIFNGSKKVEVIGPLATPPESNAIPTKIFGTKRDITSAMIYPGITIN